LSKQDFNLIKRWRDKGFRIGVCNGCFDYLHKGHKYLIKQAKKKTDKLILLINSDNSVKKIKGKFRPYEKLSVRKKKLISLREVNLVLSFNQTTPLKMIKNIKPDYIFKGSDYTKRKVSGYKFITKYGGKVIILKKLQGISTSSLIKKIKKND
tara:strand:+ start:131 stop:589 length:459 start_codon:yes stop_codon:yes gene_type:complete